MQWLPNQQLTTLTAGNVIRYKIPAHHLKVIGRDGELVELEFYLVFPGGPMAKDYIRCFFLNEGEQESIKVTEDAYLMCILSPDEIERDFALRALESITELERLRREAKIEAGDLFNRLRHNLW